jgi:hypothetical protein
MQGFGSSLKPGKQSFSLFYNQYSTRCLMRYVSVVKIEKSVCCRLLGEDSSMHCEALLLK